MAPGLLLLCASSGVKSPCWAPCLESLEKKPSTAFIHEVDAGMKRNVRSGQSFSHSLTSADLREEMLSRMTCFGTPGAIPPAAR